MARCHGYQRSRRPRTYVNDQLHLRACPAAHWSDHTLYRKLSGEWCKREIITTASPLRSRKIPQFSFSYTPSNTRSQLPHTLCRTERLCDNGAIVPATSPFSTTEREFPFKHRIGRTLRFGTDTRGSYSARFFTSRHDYWPQTFHLGCRKPRIVKRSRKAPLHTYSPDYIRYLSSLIHERR